MRVLCHYLVDSVPDAGVTEMASSIASVLEYYAKPRVSAVAVRSLPPLAARLAEATRSPAAYVEEED